MTLDRSSRSPFAIPILVMLGLSILIVGSIWLALGSGAPASSHGDTTILNCNVTGTGGDRADLRGIRFTVNQSFVSVEVRMAASVAGSYGFTAELRRSTGFTAAVEASVPVSETMPSSASTPYKVIHIDFSSTVNVTSTETFTLKFSDVTGQGFLFIEQTGFVNLPCAGVEETNENSVANPTERSDPAGFKVLGLTVGVCGTQGLPLVEHGQATVLFTPASGVAGSQFNVDLRDVDQTSIGEPAEAYWDDFIGGAALPQGVSYGTLIGQGTIPQGETLTAFTATVPSDASEGQHAVTVCWRLNNDEKWYFKQANFDVAGPSTPTPTPTPSATPLPLFAFLPLPNILPVVFGTPDLSIHGIEITQAVQCFDTSNGLAGCPDNSLPVVAQKHTTARIYPKYSGLFTQMAGVPVRLHIFANGVEYIMNTFGTAKTFIDQANNDNANVWFNVNFTNDVNVSFYAEVDPDNVIAESNESNNRFPATGTMTMTFQKRDQLDITSWRTRYHPSGYTGTQYAEGWAVNGGAADWLEVLWPVRSGNGIDHTLKSGYLNWTTAVSGGTNAQNSAGQHALIQRLNSEWVMHSILPFLFGTNALTGAEHVYGWVDAQGYGGGHADMPVYPHAGGLGVVGIGTDNFSGSPSVDSPSSGATIFGHELTHNYDVYHTNTGGDDCGSNDSNSDFPYNSSSIQEFGYNPDTGKIYDPAGTHDLMSYCPPGSKEAWIAPFTWNKMFGIFNVSGSGNSVAGPSTPYGQVLSTGAQTSLVGSVFVDNPDIDGDDGAALENLHKVDGVGLQVNPPPGAYQVQLRNGDTILGTKAFTVDFTSEYSSHVGPEAATQAAEEVFSPQPAPFAQIPFIMPWVDGATSVAIVLEGQVLDEVFVSANAPVVNFTSPAGPETWAAGETRTLTWEGSDVDGDSLTYSILYTAADDVWELIASGITGTSYDVEVDFFAGSDSAQFGVVATDGINIGSDESPLISIPNKPPMISISNPAPGTVITPGGLVVLSGAAVDLEDGSLGDDVYQWSSDRDGDLGTGPSLPVNTLSNGVHTLTLRVEDSDGASAEATVDVLVAVPAVIDVQPDVISPGGSPPVVTVIVILPFGYPTDTLDPDSLQMIIGAETLDPTSIESLGDTDSDGLIELKLTFDGAAVQSALPGGFGTASARIVGETDGGIGVQGSDTISQVSVGDANCDGSVNPVDSLTVLRYDAGLPVTPPEDCILLTADINCDGKINPIDSLGILRFDAGLPVSQPDDCPLPGTAPIASAVGSDIEVSTSNRGFPALPPIAWLGLAFVLPAVVLTVRRKY